MKEQQSVQTLRELWRLAQGKCSVVVPQARCFDKPRPAAFMINLPGYVLMNLFETGMYVYEPKKKGRT